MNGQLTIDDAPRHRATDPATARRAAAAQTPARMSQGRLEVLAALFSDGPGTDFELGDRVGRQQTSAGKRRGELVKLGLVERVGVGRAPSGAAAAVWALTPAGRDFYRSLIASEVQS